MPTAEQKIVKVGDDVIAFPGDLEDTHVAKLIKSFRDEKRNKPKPDAFSGKTTEETEHTRQLKPAQPLSSALPSLPDWANKPLLNDKDLAETPKGQAVTAKSQKEFETAHPKITAAINKGNNPVVLGTLKGTNEFIKGMTSPANAALMLAAPESKILSGIFAAQAMKGSFRDAQSAKTAFEAGHNEEAMNYVTQALLGAGIAGLAGTHAYKGLPEGVRTKLGSEEGSVPITPAKPDSKLESEEGYAYHATNLDRLHDIANTGKLNIYGPSYGTNQSMWPDRSTKKRAYFTPKAGSAWQFAPEEGTPAIVRTKSEGLKKEGHTGDLYSEAAIGSHNLEYLGADKQWHPIQKLATPEAGNRTYYRGQNPESTEKIKTGDDFWDSLLFVADEPKHAENYGRNIDKVQLKPDAHILREGTPRFRQIVGPYRQGENMLSYSSRAAKAAKDAGYDAVHFQLQGTVGTAILNRDAVESSAPHNYAPQLPDVKAKAAELQPFSYGHTPERRSIARQTADIQAKKAEFDKDLAAAEAKLAKHGNQAIVSNSPEYEESVRNVMNIRDKQRAAQAALDRLKVSAQSLTEVKKKAAELKPTTAYKAVDQSQPFYLKSENLINEKMKGPMPAEDVHKMLLSNGVKPEEMQWTGLDEFLSEKGNSKVTPQEIQEHLAGNNLQIHEVVKTGDHNTELGPGEARYASYVLPGAEPQSYRELVLTMPPKMKEATPIEFKETERFKGEPVYRAEVKGGEAIISHNPGFPWRVDLPNGESDGGFPTAEAAMKAIKNNPRYQWTVPQNNVFKSNHWPEDVNPLGHIRFNDRIGLNGERILHIEELQSDMHQAGRRGRYTDPEKPFAVTGVAGQFATREEAQAAAKELFETSHLKGDPNNFVNDERVDRLPNGVVPDAPFKKTWPGLMLKRMIQYAATHGYDGISWTPGEEQADRYDLSKEISEIHYSGTNLKAYDHDGNTVIEKTGVSQQELPDIIGKEAAQKLIAQEPKGTLRSLVGQDLKVGGEGMKGFYDKIIPDAANKLGKQWGAKVGETTIEAEKYPMAEEWTKDSAKIIHRGNGYEVWATGANGVDKFRNAFDSEEEAQKFIDEHVPGYKKALKVPYLPLKPETRTGIKSVPYSLFGVAGAALTLAQVKQKADELKAQFQKAGLSR